MNELLINQVAVHTITVGASGNTGLPHTCRHIIINLKDYKTKIKLN
jgi:hypothetical protein